MTEFFSHSKTNIPLPCPLLFSDFSITLKFIQFKQEIIMVNGNYSAISDVFAFCRCVVFPFHKVKKKEISVSS